MDGVEFKSQATRQAEAVALARKATLLPLLKQNLDLVQLPTRTISAEEKQRSAEAAGFNQVRPIAQIASLVSIYFTRVLICFAVAFDFCYRP